jgi:hypothetical protein
VSSPVPVPRPPPPPVLPPCRHGWRHRRIAPRILLPRESDGLEAACFLGVSRADAPPPPCFDRRSMITG